MWAVNLYFWIAAVGFPILGSHWLNYERKMSKRDYMTGHDDGWADGWDEALDTAAGEFNSTTKTVIMSHADVQHRIRSLKNIEAAN